MTAVVSGLKNGERARRALLSQSYELEEGDKKNSNSTPTQHGRRRSREGRDRWISVSSGREGRSEEGKEGWREERKEEENKLRTLKLQTSNQNSII